MSYTVSVAMATYNGEKYLREQLDSIYGQTLVPDEVVVYDDKSSDGTVEILEEYKIKYGLKYYINDVNHGVNRNFENAIRACVGDYVAISDQDDKWFPNKVHDSITKLREIEQKGSIPAVVTSKALRADSNLNVLPTNIPETDLEGYESSICRYLAHGSSIFMNRKAIELLIPFPEKGLLYDDYIGTAVACIGAKYFICTPMMYYRIHSSNAHYKIKKMSLWSRLINKIAYPKYNAFIPSQRYDAVEYIYNRFKDILLPDAKTYMEHLLDYRHGNLIKKANSLKYLVCDKKKYKKILFTTVITYFIPIKEQNKYKW